MFTFFIYIYFRYTNNGKAYSESDYGSEYGMMDNGDGDAGRGLLKKLISIYYMFCETQPFVNIFQDIKFQHLEEEFHQNIHKATMDLRLTDQDIKQFFFSSNSSNLSLKAGCVFLTVTIKIWILKFFQLLKRIILWHELTTLFKTTVIKNQLLYRINRMINAW